MSRTRTSSQLEFLNHSVIVDYEEGRENSVWILLAASSISGERRYVFNDFNASHPFIIFNFDFQRISHEYLFQIIIPAVVLMLVNIFLLLLHPESNDRFILYVINVFSHCIFWEQLIWM
jgi:hypothetical protein